MIAILSVWITIIYVLGAGSSTSRSPGTRTRSPRTRSRSPNTRTQSQSWLPRSPSTQASPPETNPPTEQEEQTVGVNIDIDVEILAAMGSVEEETKIGPPAHIEIVQRWTPILTKGLPKEEKALLKDYPLFNNIAAMIPPKLNPELAAAVSEQVKKRDLIIEYRQRNNLCLSSHWVGLRMFSDKRKQK